MSDFGLCSFLGFLFVSYCSSTPKKVPNKLTVDFEWSIINFTWPSITDYHDAVFSRRYISENNAISNVKIYKGVMYITLPRMLDGTPVTLASLSTSSIGRRNELLTPYPSWNMNVQNNCSSLQNVRAIEIDKFGVMWVLDGVRVNDLTKCPSKLVLLDVNNSGQVMDSFEFPETVCPRKSCFLYNVVIDDRDGGYAFITDHSLVDPGIVVYSRHKNRAWKLRDRSMFPEVKDSIIIEGIVVDNMAPVAGIALSPTPRYAKQDRTVYYSTLSGYNVYSVNAKVLKDEDYSKSGKWRRNVVVAGKKTGQGDGMIMDNKGNVFFFNILKHSISKWNTKNRMDDDSENFLVKTNVLSWPESFCFDYDGNLYVSDVGVNRFYVPTQKTEVKFKILKIKARTKSYIYS